MLSKACIVGIYQRKLEAIAALGVELLVLVPPAWRDERGEQPLERAYTDGYTLRVVPIRLNGNFHLHHYGDVGTQIRAFHPQLVHIDEEPYNLAAWQALFHARRAGAKTLAFSWQNIRRQYPPPFVWGERWTLRRLDALIAGTQSAAEVWRQKGYTGRLAVIPQFGIDAQLFTPASTRHPAAAQPVFTIGYIGRLVPEKGIDLLLRAAAQLAAPWRLRIIGGGPERPYLQALAGQLGIAAQVEFVPQRPSTEMPMLYHTLDVLALPSLTRANWKEQFGRVLVEAMASGVAVVGSDSGAIPDVIGTAGLIVPEGDSAALAGALGRLQQDAGLRAALAQQGHARALALFTQEQVAQQTVAVYRAVLG